VLGALSACTQPQTIVKLAGATMGTTWHVTYVAPEGGPDEGQVLSGIEARLEEVNAGMSTYRSDSEISRFNAALPGEWVEVSPSFYEVLSTAIQVGANSRGAYDVTVGPLVNLWGFGPAPAADQVPSAHDIEQQLARTGQDQLRLDGEGLRVRKLVQISLDFSSLAKGYAVDRVALWLNEQGIGHFLVEVGGEMRLAGLSGRGDPWRVAIEQPEMGSRAAAAAIQLTDQSVATSGDYRNYLERDGRRYSHSIDPRTGYPVAHELVSVTVVHPSAMLADAWATALTVLGPTDALAVAQVQGLAVYFIHRDGEDFAHSHTAAFEQFLAAGVQSRAAPAEGNK
jgi:thiamine biosynthesis lipoprotein